MTAHLISAALLRGHARPLAPPNQRPCNRTGWRDNKPRAPSMDGRSLKQAKKPVEEDSNTP